MDMAQVPDQPDDAQRVATTQYTGFQTRPGKTAGTYRRQTRRTRRPGDCSSATARTPNYFDGQREAGEPHPDRGDGDLRELPHRAPTSR